MKITVTHDSVGSDVNYNLTFTTRPSENVQPSDKEVDSLINEIKVSVSGGSATSVHTSSHSQRSMMLPDIHENVRASQVHKRAREMEEEKVRSVKLQKNDHLVITLKDADESVLPEPTSTQRKKLNRASKKGNLDAILRLIDTVKFSPADKSKALAAACEHGRYNIVYWFLQEPDIEPGTNDSIALRKAIDNGKDDVVELLLLDGRVDPEVAKKKVDSAIQ